MADQRVRPDLIRGKLDRPGLLAQLRRQRLWLAVGVVVAGFAAASRFAAIGLLPPSFHMTAFAHSTASAQLVVGQGSALRSGVPDRYLGNFAPRAEALADIVASPLVRGYVARAAGVPASEIGVDAPLWRDLQRAQQWATGQKRASQIVAERYPYHIALNDDSTALPYTPVIDVVTQAPSTKAAVGLANGVAAGLDTYLSDIQTAAGTPRSGVYRVRQLAPVSVVPASTAQLANVGAFTLLAVFVLWSGLILAVSSVSRDLRAARTGSKVPGALDRLSDSWPTWPAPTGASTSSG